MLTGLITELEAVNKILAVGGDTPVQTLEDSYIQAKLARQVLIRASRDIQQIGWWFNEEQSVQLIPDLGGFITLGLNVITCQIKGDYGGIIQRGKKIYNRRDRTYTFTQPLTADLVLALDWEELPESARAHITDRACRIYNADFVGNNDLVSELKTNEGDSYIAMKKEDVEARDPNLLRNQRVYNIAFRNRRPR